MRIAFVLNSFSPPSQTFIYDRVCKLDRKGLDVHVVSKKRRLVKERPFPNIQTVKKPTIFMRLLLLVKGGWNFFVGAPEAFECNKNASYYRGAYAKIIKRINPDIIHGEFGDIGTLLAPVANKLDLPFVLYMHGYDISIYGKDPKWCKCYERMWPDIKLIMTPSEFMRAKVIDLGASPEKVVVLHNGIDIANWDYSDPILRFDGKIVRFLFVGRLVEKKGPVLLLEAFQSCLKQLEGVDAKLVICGEGPLLQDVQSFIKFAGLGDKIELRGACSHDQVRQEMNDAHIMVQHSVTSVNGDTEGLPVSLTEAAAVGLPIISTRHSGIPEIVRDGINGYLVEEYDIEAMATSMVDLAHNPSKWGVMGRAGRKIIEEEFDQSRVIEDYLEMISKI